MLKEKDFIELEFTGRVKNGEIFDTNIKEEAKKIDLDINTRPLITCLGQNMILPAIDKFLVGKEVNKKYELDLKPEEAFGARNRELIKTMPMSVFKEQQVAPKPGMIFQFDTMMGRISAVSGGRVIVDFNNPLAGKEVSYSLEVKRKVEDINEKTKSIINFLFKQDIPFKIEEKKLIIEGEKSIIGFVQMFNEKFKEILDLELETKEIKLSNQESASNN
ncbi:MAG: peptidylprolyl isomerase [archaeon]